MLAKNRQFCNMLEITRSLNVNTQRRDCRGRHAERQAAIASATHSPLISYEFRLPALPGVLCLCRILCNIDPCVRGSNLSQNRPTRTAARILVKNLVDLSMSGYFTPV